MASKTGRGKGKGTVAGKFLGSASGGKKPRRRTTDTKNVKFRGTQTKFKRKNKRAA